MHCLLSGCGVYAQGPDALEKLSAVLLERHLQKPLVLAGHKAFAAAEARLTGALLPEVADFAPMLWEGFCTDGEIARCAAAARERHADCVIGVGGGKVLDLSKAIAYDVGLSVFTVPTSAATCAAFAPLSVIYHSDGTQQEIRFYPNEVDGVFVDTEIIAKAPARLLAAGLADAAAKACEYASLLPETAYGRLPLGRYLGCRLAEAGDEAIAACAIPALESVRRKEVTAPMEDAVFCAVACTGIVSGLGGYNGRGQARFAIAHACNEALRGRWFPPERWLHGEAVAVGVLAQMAANGAAAKKIDIRRSLFEAIGVPTRLSQLAPALTGKDLGGLIDWIAQKTGADDRDRPIIEQAIRSVV